MCQMYYLLDCGMINRDKSFKNETDITLSIRLVAVNNCLNTDYFGLSWNQDEQHQRWSWKV